MIAKFVSHTELARFSQRVRLVSIAALLCLVSACNSTGTTSLGLDEVQQQKLDDIEIKVRQQASLLRAMSRVNVEDMLRAYDQDVRRILNPTQWRIYDDEHRQELSSQIFMTIESQRQSFKRQQRM
ncbi:MAG: hypothetical protein QMC01_00895 [Pseudomonadales bacterium]|jgi:hypothetical protein|tara:strand:+ start:251 stop:628 length:378 start_codon:yes stop_codon:yes gene_type:complete